jgi:hypothetical protein
MSNPDFSKSAEHVALAKVLHEAWRRRYSCENEFDKLNPNAQAEWLTIADAAITHCGTGIPPATEANAERLARATWSRDKCAAKPEPVFEGAQGPDAPTVAENATVARDITGEAARRKERQRLVWEATCAMSSLDMSTKSETLLGWGEELADTFIKWRDADEAEAKRRICKK